MNSRVECYRCGRGVRGAALRQAQSHLCPHGRPCRPGGEERSECPLCSAMPEGWLCQAIVDDFDHPFFAPPRHQVLVPSDKACSHKALVLVGHLALCAAHARLAREGLVAEDGRVCPKADIRAVRRRPDMFPLGMHRWLVEV